MSVREDLTAGGRPAREGVGGASRRGDGEGLDAGVDEGRAANGAVEELGEQSDARAGEIWRHDGDGVEVDRLVLRPRPAREDQDRHGEHGGAHHGRLGQKK